MRILMIAVAATMLLVPASRQALACHGDMWSAEATTTEYAAEEAKKPMKPAHKMKHHMRKEKVEYMRAAPMK